MTEKNLNTIENIIQHVINLLILFGLIGLLIAISNTNRCLNKINEKVGVQYETKTNFLGLVKCKVK